MILGVLPFPWNLSGARFSLGLALRWVLRGRLGPPIDTRSLAGLAAPAIVCPCQTVDRTLVPAIHTGYST